MRIKSFAALAGTATVGMILYLSPISGQPMYDRIHVNLPYQIMLGEKTLQPGDYTIQRLPDNGGARILLFYTDNGLKFETSVMTIPALDPDTAKQTKLVLDHVGEDYYIHKIWVEGKDYGYELPRPKGLEDKQHEKMTESTVAATSMPAATTTETAPTETPAAQTAPPVNTQPEPQPATPPAQTEPAAQPATQPAAQPATQAPAVDNSADRSMPDQDTAPATTPTQMPNTAANWLMMLLSGGTLSGAGLLLRRKR
ncbi:MAG TPA: hypothetical protein VNV86_08195 [Candidatus Acidoferrum sp.]|nr:hypothetical protein [Candidatus Acidoferrum sp.]